MRIDLGIDKVVKTLEQINKRMDALESLMKEILKNISSLRKETTFFLKCILMTLLIMWIVIIFVIILT